MKNKILKIIILVFIYSSAYGNITVYNDSNLDLYFEIHGIGCYDAYCQNPWTGEVIALPRGVTCCSGISNPLKGRTYNTDSSQSTIVFGNFPDIANLMLTAHSEDGRSWSKNLSSDSDHSTFRFPGDFSVSASDLTKLTPPKHQ